MSQLCDGHNYPALFCCRELSASFNLIPISHLAVDGRLIIEAPVDYALIRVMEYFERSDDGKKKKKEEEE